MLLLFLPTADRRLPTRLRLQHHPRHRRNRRQRLPAKSQGGNVQQVIRIFDLGSRVPLKGQQRVVAHHAAAIVADLDEFLAACLDLDLDAPRAGVQCILQQLLHYAGRPLHHLAGSDLVGDPVRQHMDAAHAPHSLTASANLTADFTDLTDS